MKRCRFLAILLFIMFMRVAPSQATRLIHEEVERISWSPDSSKIAIAAGPFTCDDPDNPHPSAYAVPILIIATGQIEKHFPGSTCALIDVDWSPDGTKLATSSFAGNEAFIWDVVSETLLEISSIHAEVGIEVVWSPDSTRIASTFNGGKYAVVWDATTGEVLFKLGDHDDYTTSVSWSPDGSQLATSSLDGTVRIWDVASQEPILILSYSDELYWASWNPDGSKIASGSRDGAVQVWDTATGQLLNNFRGHTDSVERVVWHPNGTQIASGSLDGTVRVWDIRARQVVSTIESDLGPVVDVAWSPDGTRLAYIGKNSGGESIQVRIVPVPAISPINSPTPRP